jgi:hypothetical protein
MSGSVYGDRGHGVAEDQKNNPVKIGGKAHTGQPVAVDDADRVDAFFDEFGTQAVKLVAAADGTDLGGDTSGLFVQGPAAENAAAAGNPLLMGGRYDATLRALGAGDAGAIALDVDGRIQIAHPGTLTIVQDITANDSGKSFTVPTGKQWRVMALRIELISTATAGNRRIEIRLKKADGATIWFTEAKDLQAASLTRDYSAGIGVPYTAFADSAGGAKAHIPFPDTWLDAAFSVQVQDAVGVDAAADDMDLYLTYFERDSV